MILYILVSYILFTFIILAFKSYLILLIIHFLLWTDLAQFNVLPFHTIL